MTPEDCFKIVREVSKHTPDTRSDFITDQGTRYISDFLYAFSLINKCVKSGNGTFFSDYSVVSHNKFVRATSTSAVLLNTPKKTWRELEILYIFFRDKTREKSRPQKKSSKLRHIDQTHLDLFNDILVGKVNLIGMYSTVLKLTDTYSIDRLEELIKSFNLFIEVKKEEKEAEYTAEDVKNVVEEYHKLGLELPPSAFKEISDSKSKGRTGTKVFDKEQLLFPLHFHHCYRFKKVVTSCWEDALKELKTMSGEKLPDEFMMKPIFPPELVPEIYRILKDFFSPGHQIHLKRILMTGNSMSEPILFLNNGNRLADAFKQLINADFITGCQKKDLEFWIGKNFKYLYRGKIKDFTPHYLNDIISTNKDKCQKPLLNIILDKPSGRYLITKT